MRDNHKNQIKRKILSLKEGTIITSGDFLDIANYNSVKNVLSKLEKEKIIFRVLRGIYKVPNYNKLLDLEIPANVNDVAEAIAKNNNWNIVPKGDAALNNLGLTTQVPAVYEYISDGPYKIYNYEGNIIKLYKKSNKYISGMSYKTALIIEALKTLGEDNISEKERILIFHNLSSADMDNLYIESKNSISWIFEEIIKILKEGGYNVRNSQNVIEKQK